MKHIAILGSTGSIGRNCLDVVRAHRECITVEGLTAHRKWELLAEQCREFCPAQVAVGDPSLSESIPPGSFGSASVTFGPKGIEEVASNPNVDLVVSSIVGAAGLRGLLG